MVPLWNFFTTHFCVMKTLILSVKDIESAINGSRHYFPHVPTPECQFANLAIPIFYLRLKIIQRHPFKDDCFCLRWPGGKQTQAGYFNLHLISHFCAVPWTTRQLVVVTVKLPSHDDYIRFMLVNEVERHRVRITLFRSAGIPRYCNYWSKPGLLLEAWAYSTLPLVS